MGPESIVPLYYLPKKDVDALDAYLLALEGS
jgi:hypothetical protein